MSILRARPEHAQGTNGDPNPVTELLSQLSLEDKTLLTAGADSWRSNGVPQHGIGAIKFTDGPVGARGDMASQTNALLFPCGSALGATWDVALASQVGAELAEQTRSKGAQVLLAPTVNLHRTPLAGRNFECLSEDPELTARMACALVRGLQDNGIGASIKHFVANDQETDRMTISSVVDERTLRELYLRPFEAAVADADPWTIMASYNRLNGTFATQHRWLLKDVLKEEWGYPGAVISDWWATKDSVAPTAAGLDLEMPGPGLYLGSRLAELVSSGQVGADDVDEMVRRLLELIRRANRLGTDALPEERDGDSQAGRALSRRVGSEAIVLLGNRGVLPLDQAKLSSIAVVGPGADPGFVQGGGSARLPLHRVISPVDGLRAALPGARVETARGTAIGRLVTPIHPALLPDDGWQAEFWATPDGEGAPVLREHWQTVQLSRLTRQLPGISRSGPFRARFATTFTPDSTGRWEFEVACVGTARLAVDGDDVLSFSGELSPLDVFPLHVPTQRVKILLTEATPVTLEAELVVEGRLAPQLHIGAISPRPELEIERAAALAASCDAAVVVVGTSDEFESEGFDRQTLALPGRQDALVEAVIRAQPNTVVVVSAGAPVDLPWAAEAPALVWNWFGGQEAGHALADVLLGKTDPGGRLPFTIPGSSPAATALSIVPVAGPEVHYNEGLLIGYRRYVAQGVTPQFPFGFGLSYANFELGAAAASVRADGGVDISLQVMNTANRAGSDVVQIYVEAPSGHHDLPPSQLAGFTKVRLEPGASITARVSIPPRALSHWSTADNCWRIPAGPRTLRIGHSVDDPGQCVTVELSDRCLPTPQP